MGKKSSAWFMKRQLRATQDQGVIWRATNQMNEKDKSHADGFDIGKKKETF